MARNDDTTVQVLEPQECRPGEQGALGWREAAVIVALGDNNGGDLLQPILSLIRENLPNSSQAILHGVRFGRAVEILRRETTVDDDILRGAITSYAEGKSAFSPYVGWSHFCWESEAVEILSVPSVRLNALVFVSNSKEAAEAAAAFVGEMAQVPKSRCLVFSGMGWREAPELEEEIDGASWDGIILPTDTISAIRNSFERFFERREEYGRLGFPWRRGILLVGPTGTGKTSVFSSLSYESLGLLTDTGLLLTLLNTLGQLVLGLLFVYFGVVVGRLIGGA